MADLINKRLGKYRIVEEIGRGGMATVYKAWDPEHRRHVAIKVLHAQLSADTLFVKRFQQEAAAASSLSHRNIVAVYDVGQEDDFYYLVMEYLEGKALSQVLAKKGLLPLTRTVVVIRQVAGALDYAHSKGFVHRDVKPTNILLTKEGEAILTDFGIAKATSGTTLTRTGMLVGTPQYMSPEQCLGKEVDHRSDIYSLGVVLYEMLTGRVPFTADNTPSILYMHVHETMTSLTSVNPAIPSRIEHVVAKALAKQPEDRYGMAGEMALALERSLSVEPAPEEAATTATRPLPRQGPRARRRQALLGAMIATVALAVGTLVIASLAHLARLWAGAAGGGTATAVVSLQATVAPHRPTSTSQPLALSVPSPTTSQTPEPTPTPTAAVTYTPTAQPTPSSTRTPTPTPAPPTATPEPPGIVVDGLGADWVGWDPILEDRAGDSLAGSDTDLRAAYIAENDDFVSIMIRTEENLRKGEGTVELNVDLRPGTVCGRSNELHTTIGSHDNLSGWENYPCGSLIPYQIDGAVVSWWDVLEVQIPRHSLGEHVFVRPIWVCFWLPSDGDLIAVDCMSE